MYGISKRAARGISSVTAGLVIAVIILAGAVGYISTQRPTTQTITQTVTQTLTQTITTTAAAAPPPPPPPPPAPKVTGKPKILRIGIGSFGANLLDPTLCSTSFCAQVNMQIYERLLDYDAKAKDFINLKPRLVESMDVSPDGLAYTFKLRKGILFHTGNELTSDAVVFTIKRMTAANFTVPFFPGKQPYTEQYLPYIDHNSAKAVDKYTVQIRLKKPNAVFPVLLGGILTPYASIQDSVLMKNAKKVLNGTDWGAQWLIDGHDAGTGPYFVREFVPDQRLVLAAYPLYWQGKARIDEVHYLVVKDPNVQALMLTRGDLHLALDVGVEQIPALQGKPNIKLLRTPDASGFGVGFNANRTNSPEALRKLGVRQAIANLVDWESILNDIMKGAGAPMYGAFPKGLLGWDAFGGETLYKYNLEKAKQLLTEAGYPNGIPQKLRMYHYEQGLGGIPWQDIALFIKDRLAKAGVQVELETGPVATIESKWRGGDFDIFLTWSSFRYNDPDGPVLVYNTVHGPRAGLKWTFADELKQRGVETVDQAKRADVYKRFQTEVYAKSLLYYYYLQYGRWIVTSDKVIDYYLPAPLASFQIQYYFMDMQE